MSKEQAYANWKESTIKVQEARLAVALANNDYAIALLENHMRLSEWQALEGKKAVKHK